MGMVSTAATTDSSDTVPINLSKFGMTRLFHAYGFTHTTLNSVVVREDPTVAIDGDSVVLTVGGATANKARYFVLYGI